MPASLVASSVTSAHFLCQRCRQRLARYVSDCGFLPAIVPLLMTRQLKCERSCQVVPEQGSAQAQLVSLPEIDQAMSDLPQFSERHLRRHDPERM